MRKSACLSLFLALTAVAGTGVAFAEPVEVVFGSEIRKLQELVDRRYGAGRIDVTKDFIGARAGDLDPWCWSADHFGMVRVRMLQRNRSVNATGWYVESSGTSGPLDQGSLFIGEPASIEEKVVTLPGLCRFGFYIETSDGGRSTRRFFSNRSLNTQWTGGQGTIRPPFGGCVQALIFDVSRWRGVGTWLVCFEDLDASGFPIIGNGGNTPPPPPVVDGASRVADNDFDDVVFEVSAEGATYARPISFGSLKLLYR